MSPRKKNTSKAGPSQQSTINNFFSTKAKHASASTRPKRLARSSLAARPLGSKRSPDQEILDLTQSTSPVRGSESPPSTKKRKLDATSPDRSPVNGAQTDSFQYAPSRSTSPVSHISQKLAEIEPGSNIQPLASPAPSQTGYSQPMLDIDLDEIIESSQTQYIHLRFTPSSQRVTNTDPRHVPAPIFTPVSTQSRQPSHEPSSIRKSPRPLDAAEESQSTFFIPSSQGEISEPFTPRKRDRSLSDQPGTSQTPAGAMPPSAQGSNTVSRSTDTPKRQRPPSAMRPPVHAAFAKTPIRHRLGGTNPFTPQFSSPQPIPSPMYPSDQLPSEDPSIDATELGTVQSPPKPVKHPTTTTNLLPCIPESVPASKDTPHSVQRAPTPLASTSNLNTNSPRTPHRSAPHNPPSSPTDFPSPGAIMASLGFRPPRNVDHVPTSDPRPSAPPSGEEMRTPARASEAADSQARGEESPNRSQSSSQTVIPSSQPMHDSSPPPEYDLDPKRHSFNQGRLQSIDQPPVSAQSKPAFDPRLSSNSSRPYFTAPAHRSPCPSSQSLPPSQSPIMGGQIDPNRSAAGMRSVFGMLGFGSETNDHEPETHQEDDEFNPHTPITYDLPPSSPPPESPTRYELRESSPASYLVPASARKGKGKSRVRKTPIRDSPLARAFEAAKKRSKTATPSAARRLTPKVGQVASSPIRPTHLDDMDIDSSPVQDSESKSKRSTPRIGKNKARLGIEQSPSLTRRSRRASEATQRKDARQAKPSTQSQRQMSVDNEIIESSDAEEMEIDIRPSAIPTCTRATAGIKSSGEPMKPVTDTPRRDRASIRPPEDRQDAPATPVREERLPSSVSPSPIRIHLSPSPPNPRYSSPPLPQSENTQTQDEAETPWESLRPSQSVSQVYERQLLEEIERERRSRMEQNAEKQKSKVLVEESPDMPDDGEAEEEDRTESQQEEESLDQEPVRPVTISLNPRSPTNAPSEAPRLPLPRYFSTPKTGRTMEKAHYIVTPTKSARQTPAGATPSRKSITPSSMAGEDDPEEYTYVEETFNPTESQQSFLNRILQGSNSELS